MYFCVVPIIIIYPAITCIHYTLTIYTLHILSNKKYRQIINARIHQLTNNPAYNIQSITYFIYILIKKETIKSHPSIFNIAKLIISSIDDIGICWLLMRSKNWVGLLGESWRMGFFGFFWSFFGFCWVFGVDEEDGIGWWGVGWIFGEGGCVLNLLWGIFL